MIMTIDSNTQVFLGNREIVQILKDGVTIWEKGSSTNEYFYVENTYAGENTLTLNTQKGGTPTSGTYATSIEYSKDKETWTTLDISTTGSRTITMDEGEKVYFRGNEGVFNNYVTYNNYWRNVLTCSQSHIVGGNINSLLDYNNMDTVSITQGCFYYLFYGNTTVTDAGGLVLPATTLASGCYNNMFYGCTSLTTAPELPATTLTTYCYQGMFQGCTSLTTVPELPATTLTSRCYENMFNGCTSLTTAPTLPATTLATYCYSSMFYGCTSLTTAPNLPATTLANYCYQYMFYGCTSLTTAPALPATTLATYCYDSMFNDCTSLTTAPALPATTLAQSCYTQMFKGCTSLTTVPSTLPATTLAQSCYYSMFERCIRLTTAPILPATTLAQSCYNSMFKSCTSLTTAPSLPATTLAQSCYDNMFQYCSHLNSVTSYAEDISANNCLSDWLNGVSTTGTFNNYGAITYPQGTSGIPTGWTEVLPPISTVTPSPNEFSVYSFQSSITCNYTLTIVLQDERTLTRSLLETYNIGTNDGDTTRTITQNLQYGGISYSINIVQTANDPIPAGTWSVSSTGTYPFELNTDGYYESTNKGVNSSYSYATLTYEGFSTLTLECISYTAGEANYDYALVSQPDMQLSESTTDDGATGSTSVFRNFKGQSSTSPVTLEIPSDYAQHTITIKFKKDDVYAAGNDSFQFKVIEPTT